MFPFPGPPLSPEQESAVRAYQKAALAAEIAERKNTVKWAPVFCSCSPWFVRGDGPPQRGCPVHSGVLLLPEGGWL